MKIVSYILILFLVTILSCSTDPEPINYGSDQCDHCRMTIVDNKFGSEIITNKGKVYKFDAAECMVNFVKQNMIKQEDIKTRLVTDASKPGEFIDAVQATYLISEKFPSPMGANLSAYGSKSDAERFQKDFSGELKSWDDILIRFNTK